MKRLFVDRDYRGSEREEDYTFIPARVHDNKFLMENDPAYVRVLENLPEDRRRAMLDGDWDVFTGQYFTEFKRELYAIEPFEIPWHWRRYVSMDYGLDMLACYFIAVDEAENAFVYKEIYESGLIVSDAAARIREFTSEEVFACIMPRPTFGTETAIQEKALPRYSRSRAYTL